MKTTRLSTLILVFVLFAMSATAQSWRWSYSGGSNNNSTLDYHPEFIWDMATDRNGNVYTISTIGNKGINVAGQYSQKWVTSQINYSQEVMINSFTCNGVLRWTKLIGTEIGGDRGYAVRTDSADGVYAVMKLARTSSPANVHIDSDTTINGTSHKTFYIVKYDTAGAYKWITSPQEDTIGFYTYLSTEIVDMEADGQGNLYCLAHLPIGIYGGAGGYVATAEGEYIVKYDKNGMFKGMTKLEALTSSGFNARFVRDQATGRYYVAGTDYTGIILPGDTVSHNMYVIAFDKDGKYLWKRENTTQYQCGFWGRPLLDGTGHLYVSGGTMAGDVFNGYAVTTNSSQRVPFIAKMDTDGKPVWAHAALAEGEGWGRGLALRNSGEVDLIAEASYLRWPGSTDSVDYDFVRPALTRFNTHTGKVLGIDAVFAKTYWPSLTFAAAQPTAIIAAGSNSVYIGGGFVDTLTIGSKIMISTGGADDFFFTRYGYDHCDCDTLPDPSFTAYSIGNAYQFTYTGLHPFQSILWDFGDGATSTQTNPSHTFPPMGKFDVTVMVTNDCGDITLGAAIVTVGVKEVETTQVNIYPNPATDKLTIESAAPNSTVHIFDIAGRLHQTATIRNNGTNTISIANLPAGQYLLKLSLAGEAGSLHKFIKQ